MTVTGTLVVRARRTLVAAAAIPLLAATPTGIGWIQSLYDGGDALLQRPLAAVALILLAAMLFGLWVAPSWLLASWLNPDDSHAVRALRAIPLAFVIQPIAHGAVLALVGRDANAEQLRWATIVAQSVLLAVASFLPVVHAVHRPTWGRERWLLTAVVSFALVLILAPYLAWYDFSSDGVELLTVGRTLSAHVVPRFWQGGLPPADLVMLTAGYPVGWLAIVAGPNELAARLPTLGYAAGIALAVVAIAERQSGRTLSGREFGTLLVGAVSVVVTIALNTSYAAYTIDMSSPASIDVLAAFFLLAALYFLFAGSPLWLVLNATLLSLTRPTGLILFAFLAVAFFVLERDWRSQRFRLALGAFAVCCGVSVAYGALSGSEGSMLDRVRYLRFDDWGKIRYLIIPSGVIPVLSWLRWRKMPTDARALALMALAYFGFFYCVAFYSLHHFLPAMLLPLVAFWSSELKDANPMSNGRLGVTVAGLLLSIALALPRDLSVFRDARRVGSEIVYDIGEYGGTYREMRAAFAGSALLSQLFNSPWIPNPDRARISEPFALLHYADHSSSPGSPQYLVQSPQAAPPSDMIVAASTPLATIYVRDSARREAEKVNPPPLAPRSRWYDVPRTSLFRHLGLSAGVAQVDLMAVARRARELLRAN